MGGLQGHVSLARGGRCLRLRCSSYHRILYTGFNLSSSRVHALPLSFASPVLLGPRQTLRYLCHFPQDVGARRSRLHFRPPGRVAREHRVGPGRDRCGCGFVQQSESRACDFLTCGRSQGLEALTLCAGPSRRHLQAQARVGHQGAVRCWAPSFRGELHPGDGRQGGSGERLVMKTRLTRQLPNDIHWHFVGSLQSNKAKLAACGWYFHMCPLR